MTLSEERLREMPDSILKLVEGCLAAYAAPEGYADGDGTIPEPNQGELARDVLQRFRSALSLRSDAHTSGEVKALEWAHEDSVDYSYCILGWYKISGGRPDGQYWVEGPRSGWFSATVDEAKAAAQADFETRIRSALSLGQPIQGEAVAYLHKPTGNVFSAKDHAILLPKWQRQFAADMTADEIAADFTPLFASPQPPTTAGVREITDEMVERATIEYLSHKGERPHRVTRGGWELWEGSTDAMRAALAAAKGARE
jgi:hypothetical protein